MLFRSLVTSSLSSFLTTLYNASEHEMAPLEATMLVLDNSQFSINGDYSRTLCSGALQPASSLITSRSYSPSSSSGRGPHHLQQQT